MRTAFPALSSSGTTKATASLSAGSRTRPVERGRLGQGLAVPEKSLDMEGQGFGGHAPSFFKGLARGDATREIGKADAVVGLTGFVQIGDVMHGDHLNFRPGSWLEPGAFEDGRDGRAVVQNIEYSRRHILDDAAMISMTMRSRRQTGAIPRFHAFGDRASSAGEPSCRRPLKAA